MSHQLPAKDKAFLAEKQKLQKTISSLEATLTTQKAASDKTIKELTEEIKQLQTVIAGFEAHSHLSASEIAAHIEREQENSKSRDKLLGLFNALHGGLY